MTMIEFICSACQKIVPAETSGFSCPCGGLWQYKENSFPQDKSDIASRQMRTDRFALSLIDYSLPGLARFASFLPLPADLLQALSQDEKKTRTRALSDDLLFKDESLLPNGSFKDRGALLLAAWAKLASADLIVQDSSGNAGLSVASYAASADIPCEIYLPAKTSSEKIMKIKDKKATVRLVQGARNRSTEEAIKRLQTFFDPAGEKRVIYASHVYNPLFFLGVRTLVYEIYEELLRIPGHIFIPLGNGSLFLGIVQGLEVLLASGLIDRFPQITAVQSKNIAPIFRAFQADLKEIRPLKAKDTIASGIAIAKPPRGKEILKLAASYPIRFAVVTEKEILAARKALQEENFNVEPTAAVAYAAYLNHCQHFGRPKDTLIPLTGNN